MLEFVKDHGGIVRFSMLLKAGFHSDTLKGLLRQGVVEKIGRGLYKLSSFSMESHPDIVAASLLVPKGVVCLLSALYFFEVTSEIPRQVDLAVLRGTRFRKIDYPPVRQHPFSSEAWGAGIEEHRIDDQTVRVYCLAKTVADCFKYRNKLGMDVARDALRCAVKEKHVPPVEIMRYAKVCRVANIIKPLLEVVI